MKIYLAGPINACSDSEANDWRTEFKSVHSDCLDPMIRDYRGVEEMKFREIVENDKSDIDSCDTIVVWFERPSVGTSMEILYAWERGKPIILIDRSNAPLSPWLRYHSTQIVNSI